MTSDRNKFYIIMFLLCLAGYIWLFFNLIPKTTANELAGVCMIKNLTNISCPSCGSTRSISSMINGNFIEALKLNPLGYISAIILLVTPIMIIIDIIKRKSTLLHCYKKVECYLKQPKYSIPLIILVAVNWLWNISKGL